MRVLNLAQPDLPIRLEVVDSAAAEMLMTLIAVGDAIASPEELATYDLGAKRINALRAGIGPDLYEELSRLTAGYAKLTASLLGLVYESPEPRDAATFVDYLESRDALEVTLHLLGYYMRGHRGPLAPEVIMRAAEGDPEARRTLLQHWESKGHALAVALTGVLDLGIDRAKDMVVETLGRWDDEVFAQIRDEAMPFIQKEAKAKRALAKGHSPERVVEMATNGVQFSPEPGVARIVLFPTYVLRPWVVISEAKETKLYCFPVSDETLGIDESEPPPQLVKLYKALGDANRLRLLRRLAAGSLSLKEATGLLGTAKSTAHHHLAILRQAGLVWVREDEDSVYSLREDLIPQASELLETYLRRRPAERSSAAGGGRVRR